MYGVMIKGLFCGSDRREYVRQTDNQKVISFVNLVSVNSDVFKISSEKDYSGSVLFGDEVLFSVRPRVYNGTLYWGGELVQED